jgi:hypothetical protein
MRVKHPPSAQTIERNRLEAERYRVEKLDAPYRASVRDIKLSVWGFNPDATWDEYHEDKFNGPELRPGWSFTTWITERVATWQRTPSPDSAEFLS